MLMTFATTLVTALTLQQTDTTVNVRPDGRLELSSYEGSITVATWTRSQVRVEASHGGRDRVEVEVAGSTVRVSGSGRHGPAEVSYKLTVPEAMSLDLSAQNGDVTIEGSKGEISVESVEGNVRVRGGSGFVSLHSVEGEVTLEGARGRVDLNSVDGNLEITDVVGDIVAETVDGEITLTQINASSVSANTVDGNITYHGTIKDGGRYRFSSHDGDVTLSVADINATVMVSTFSGDFESDFPVTLTGTKPGRKMSFTLGSGSARIELESFDGAITLRRTGGKR